jgi:hypothetical protein
MLFCSNCTLTKTDNDGKKRCNFYHQVIGQNNESRADKCEFYDDNIDLWQPETLEHSFQPRPPLIWYAERIVSEGDVVILYGVPGVGKSLLAGHIALCIATGLPAFQPSPGIDQTFLSPLTTTQAPVMWIGLDMDKRRTHDRFEFLARGVGITEENAKSIPIVMFITPTGGLDLTNKLEVHKLIKRIKAHQSKVVIIDMLSCISGATDENSASMRQVMNAIREISIDAECSIILLHHQKKGDAPTNPGDALRGSSAIAGAVDRAIQLYIKDSYWLITDTKSRDEKGDTIALDWTFDKKEGRTIRGTFYRVSVPSQAVRDQTIRLSIIEAVSKQDFNSKKALNAFVKKDLNNRGIPVGDLPGTNYIDEQIEALEKTGDLIVIRGSKGSKQYRRGPLKVDDDDQE